jgi:hypothetical protein
MYIRHTLGHYFPGKPVRVSDQYGRQLIAEGNAVEYIEPTLEDELAFSIRRSYRRYR